MKIPSDIQCNGCTICCYGEKIILYPEHGDDPTAYECESIINPATGKQTLALKKKPNGACIYLEEGRGCTIHTRAPALCKEFDCRRFYVEFMRHFSTRKERRKFLNENPGVNRKVLEEGKKRAHTLPAAEQCLDPSAQSSTLPGIDHFKPKQP